MILKALPEAASAILEAEMFEDYEWKSKVVRERIAREREQGLAAGREAMRDSVVELARSKVPGLDAAAEARIRAIEELAELRTLFTALLAATPVEAAALLA